MSSQLASKEEQEVEAQAPQPIFTDRAKYTRTVSLLITTAPATVLWIVLIFWLLFG